MPMKASLTVLGLFACILLLPVAARAQQAFDINETIDLSQVSGLPKTTPGVLTFNFPTTINEPVATGNTLDAVITFANGQNLTLSTAYDVTYDGNISTGLTLLGPGGSVLGTAPSGNTSVTIGGFEVKLNLDPSQNPGQTSVVIPSFSVGSDAITVTSVSAPEPSTLGLNLAGLGLLALIAYGRRRGSAARFVSTE